MQEERHLLIAAIEIYFPKTRVQLSTHHTTLNAASAAVLEAGMRNRVGGEVCWRKQRVEMKYKHSYCSWARATLFCAVFSNAKKLKCSVQLGK